MKFEDLTKPVPVVHQIQITGGAEDIGDWLHSSIGANHTVTLTFEIKEDNYHYDNIRRNLDCQ